MTIITPILGAPHLPFLYNVASWEDPPHMPCADWYIANERYVENGHVNSGLSNRATGRLAGYFGWDVVGTNAGNGSVRTKHYMRWKINFINHAGVHGCYGVSDIIWLLRTGHWPPPGTLVDHVNDNGLCNHAWNLQLANRSINSLKTHEQRRADAVWLEAMYAQGYDWFPRPELAIGANGGPPMDAAA